MSRYLAIGLLNVGAVALNLWVANTMSAWPSLNVFAAGYSAAVAIDRLLKYALERAAQKYDQRHIKDFSL